MSTLDDPTPCPRPRYGAMKTSRLSILGSAEASVTLPDAPKVPSLRDAKPRRPKKRQSVGWDPTIDIYDDTFALKQPATAQHQPKGEETRSTSVVNQQPNARRTSAIFAQPAQRGPIAPSGGMSNNMSPRKRRLSSVIEPGVPGAEANASHAGTNMDGRTSILQKEARRRTIYVPNDTTVFTIHPGAPISHHGKETRGARKSDVFLDLATLEEDDIEMRPQQSSQQVQGRRVSRTSISTAPRRAPLQMSGRQLQPQATQIDVAGSGGGKENVPPGGAMPKKLGKRASLIFPEKPVARSQPMLAPVGEIPEEQPVEPIKVEKKTDVVPKVSISACQSRVSVGPRRLSSAQPTTRPRSNVHRDALLSGHSAKMGQSGLGRIPTTLSVPRVSVRAPSSSTPYTALSEDIKHPEMYEEDWLSHQEQSITRLINGLFDKAARSSATLTSNKSVRQQLIDIYQSADNVLLHKRLQASLRFGALSIGPETLVQVARIKDDVGQRQRFLDLWTKTYDLEALQTAAEVVVGRRRLSSPRNSGQVEVNDSRRAKSISKFLQTFLIQNEDLGNRNSVMLSSNTSSQPNFKSQDTAHSWRRTALRSLMIIHLLDMAQRSAAFSGRNLFQNSSPYKSSTTVLQGLCRLIIPSVGDVSRVVSHLGYHLEHVQYPLEEFTYQIDNLAVDLRDGVRLTRLVESLLYPHGSLELEKDELTMTLAGGDILTSRPDYNGNQGDAWPLSQHLKYPCIGRPQRIFNVEIALAALGSVTDIDQSVLEDVKAADIVDGHREKTVKLLWSLVSRWGLNALVDFGLVEAETKRLRGFRERRQASQEDPVAATNDDYEQRYASETERYSKQLLVWVQEVGYGHDLDITNLTTSFVDGAAYRAIAAEYASSFTSAAESSNTDGLDQLLRSFGCSRSFLRLFTGLSTCPTKTTTVALVSFLASHILPIAAPHHAALALQRAFRSRQARRETRRRVVAKRLAKECAAVVQAQQRLVGAVVTLQRWWRQCVLDRRQGRRRWV
ncbi:MAG: hypothetical protein Q9162_003792 [Coniocarpon cinnabarinum]